MRMKDGRHELFKEYYCESDMNRMILRKEKEEDMIDLIAYSDGQILCSKFEVPLVSCHLPIKFFVLVALMSLVRYERLSPV